MAGNHSRTGRNGHKNAKICPSSNEQRLMIPKRSTVLEYSKHVLHVYFATKVVLLINTQKNKGCRRASEGGYSKLFLCDYERMWVNEMRIPLHITHLGEDVGVETRILRKGETRLILS